MRKNRMNNYVGGRVGWTRNERRLGRMIRDGEGHPDSGGGFDNGGGNGGSDASDSGVEDNAGPAFDDKQFWQDPNASSDQSSSDGDDDSAAFGQQLMGSIAGFNPGEVFTADIATAIADGDLSGVNTALTNAMRATMQQSVVHAAQIMQRFERQIEARIDARINSNQTTQDDTALLSQNFAAFTEPAMQPVIKGVFAQSLKHTKGDRTKALEMTRGMMKQMGQLGRQDFGIESPPSNPDDIGDGPSSLVRDLLSAK